MTEPLGVSGRTRLAAVIGSPISHSASPAIVNAGFASAGLDWLYVAFEVAPGDAARALDGMRALGLGGLSVTMPHKDAVAGLVDRLSDDAAALGAVNCVVPSGGVLVGENTDGPGFLESLEEEIGFDAAGRRIAVIGAGGAARAIILALGRAGASEVVVVNRTEARAAAAAALAGSAGRVGSADEVSDVDLIVNATPVGMLDGGLLVDPERIGSGQVVADIVYRPSQTPLLAAAVARGATTVNGLGMLVRQAAHAVRLWTGEEPSIAAMLEAARRAIDESD